LEALVRALGEELSRFRRRALAAEAQLKQQESARDTLAGAAVTPEAMALLEAENARLRERLAESADRLKGLRERLRFLRHQTESGEPS
jgi:hypothetical protein